MASELYIFEQGTPARASEVNKNFELVEKSVTDLKTVLETKIESDISSAKTDLLEDIQAVNDKANAINEKPHIIKVSDKSILPDFYMIYSNGLCYQSGSVTVSTSLELELLIPYLDTNYNASASTTQWKWEDSNGTITEKTNSTIKFKALRWAGANATANTSLTFDWHTLGYINLEEVLNEL
jgi:hypothetical protein